MFGEYTLANVEAVFTSAGFWSSLWTTLVYTIGATFLLDRVRPGGRALALRGRFRGRTFVRASVLLPYVAPVVAVTFVWKILLSPQFGLVNDWGQRFLGWDQPIAFLSQREYTISIFGWQFDVPLALLTVIAFEAWRYFPFAFLFLLARLQAVPARARGGGDRSTARRRPRSSGTSSCRSSAPSSRCCACCASS